MIDKDLVIPVKVKFYKDTINNKTDEELWDSIVLECKGIASDLFSYCKRVRNGEQDL